MNLPNLKTRNWNCRSWMNPNCCQNWNCSRNLSYCRSRNCCRSHCRSCCLSRYRSHYLSRSTNCCRNRYPNHSRNCCWLKSFLNLSCCWMRSCQSLNCCHHRWNHHRLSHHLRCCHLYKSRQGIKQVYLRTDPRCRFRTANRPNCWSFQNCYSMMRSLTKSKATVQRQVDRIVRLSLSFYDINPTVCHGV